MRRLKKLKKVAIIRSDRNLAGIGALGDLHLRVQPVSSRSDSPLDTIFQKLDWVCDRGDERFEGADWGLIFPGDIFDSWKVGLEALRRFILWKQRHPNVAIFAVFGQHDLRYRGGHEQTPLGILEAVGAVTLLGAFPAKVRPEIALWGANWGEPIPSSTEADPSFCANILVAHVTVSDKELPFSGWIHARDYLSSAIDKGFRWVVTGDNHVRFTYRFGDAILSNMGVIYRKSRAEREYQPGVAWMDFREGKPYPYHEQDLPLVDDCWIEAGEVSERTSKVEDFFLRLRQKGLGDSVDGIAAFDSALVEAAKHRGEKVLKLLLEVAGDEGLVGEI